MPSFIYYFKIALNKEESSGEWTFLLPLLTVLTLLTPQVNTVNTVNTVNKVNSVNSRAGSQSQSPAACFPICAAMSFRLLGH